MSIGKKILAIILTILGSFLSLAGAICLFAWVDMGFGDGLQKSDMEAYFVLGGILLVITLVAGVLPLVFGIKILRKNINKRKY